MLDIQALNSKQKSIWHHCLQLLKSAPKHPFTSTRTVSLATSHYNQVDIRMVVLRHFNEQQMQCTFYTDVRSNKVLQIQNNPNVALLLYDDCEHQQIRLRGVARQAPHTVRQDVWTQFSTRNKKLYATQHPPGSAHSSVRQAGQYQSLDESQSNFMVYHVSIQNLDYLQLNHDPMIRTQFICQHHQSHIEVRGQYLTP